jgi:hypothetical protein
MSEFGCDNWRLDRLDIKPVFKCPRTDVNKYDVSVCPAGDGASFGNLERTKIAEFIDCEHCEFNKQSAKKLGHVATKGPYEPRQTVDLGSQKMTIGRRIPGSSPYDSGATKVSGNS